MTIVKDLKDRVAHLDSKQHMVEVIDNWRQDPLGKTEVALAWKAGVDYLASLLPPDSHHAPDRLYPPRVSCYLDLLKEIEVSGGGLELALDDDDESEDVPGEDSTASSYAAPALEAPKALEQDLPTPTLGSGQEI